MSEQQVNVDLFAVIGRLTTEKLAAEEFFKARITELEARIVELEGKTVAPVE